MGLVVMSSPKARPGCFRYYFCFISFITPFWGNRGWGMVWYDRLELVLQSHNWHERCPCFMVGG